MKLNARENKCIKQIAKNLSNSIFASKRIILLSTLGVKVRLSGYKLFSA